MRFRIQRHDASLRQCLAESLGRSFFQAFGHVKVTRPGGATLECGRLHYEGLGQMLQARRGLGGARAGATVALRDSLDYNLMSDEAKFFRRQGVPSWLAPIPSSPTRATTTQDQGLPLHGRRGDAVRTGTHPVGPHTNGSRQHGDGRGPRGGKIDAAHERRRRDPTNEGFFNQITGSARTVGHTTITSPERDIDGYNITFNNETGDAEGHRA